MWKVYTLNLIYQTYGTNLLNFSFFIESEQTTKTSRKQHSALRTVTFNLFGLSNAAIMLQRVMDSILIGNQNCFVYAYIIVHSPTTTNFCQLSTMSFNVLRQLITIYNRKVRISPQEGCLLRKFHNWVTNFFRFQDSQGTKKSYTELFQNTEGQIQRLLRPKSKLRLKYTEQ